MLPWYQASNPRHDYSSSLMSSDADSPTVASVALSASASTSRASGSTGSVGSAEPASAAASAAAAPASAVRSAAPGTCSGASATCASGSSSSCQETAHQRHGPECDIWQARHTTTYDAEVTTSRHATHRPTHLCRLIRHLELLEVCVDLQRILSHQHSTLRTQLASVVGCMQVCVPLHMSRCVRGPK